MTARSVSKEHQRTFLRHWSDLSLLRLCVYDTHGLLQVQPCSGTPGLILSRSWGANVLRFDNSPGVQHPGEGKRILAVNNPCSQEGESRNPPEVKKQHTREKQLYAHRQEGYVTQGQGGAAGEMHHVLTRDGNKVTDNTQSCNTAFCFFAESHRRDHWVKQVSSRGDRPHVTKMESEAGSHTE